MSELPKLHTSKMYLSTNPKFMGYVREKHPEAVFVGEIALPGRGTGFTDVEGAIFYQENPPPPYTNKFFAYFRKLVNPTDLLLGEKGRYETYITGLPEDWTPIVTGVQLPNGDLMMSRSRHDFFTHGDVSLDGGPNYERIIGNIYSAKHVEINLLTKQYRRMDTQPIEAQWKPYQNAQEIA